MVDGEVPTVRSLLGVLGGLVGHEPGDRLGDEPLQRGDADAVRERRHLGVDERRCLLGQANVASAIRRARQASRSPECTRAQHRGRRYFSSTAAATSARPPSVERPIARANSAMQNSATSGAPSPARVRPVSPPGVIQVAASSIDSGGCCSAQVTAAVISTASACIAAALASRATRSTSAEESRSSRSMLGVAVMSEFKHRAPTETAGFPCCGREFSTFFSGSVVRVGFAACGVWSRLIARFARCSTTCGYGARSGFERSLRSLLDHRVTAYALCAATGAGGRRAHAPAGRGRACGSSRRSVLRSRSSR